MYPDLYASDYRALEIRGDQDEKSKQDEGKGEGGCGAATFPLSMRGSEMAVNACQEMLEDFGKPFGEGSASSRHEQGGCPVELLNVENEDVPFLDACCQWIWGDAAASESLQYSKHLYGTTFGEPYVIAGELWCSCSVTRADT